MYLTPNDFAIQDGEIVVSRQGYTIVFFFTHDCRFCHDLKPAFDYLSKMIKGVQFVYMDVAANNYEMPRKAARTGNKNDLIEVVPTLRLYANGRFVAQLSNIEDDNTTNISNIHTFIINNTQENRKIGKHTTGTNDSIPPYSIGIPGNMALKNVCKLYDDAYGAE
jgi:thiol-disulfide isomerase/thioredoxin